MAYDGISLPVSALRQLIKDFGTCLDFRSGGIVKIGTENPFTGNYYFAGWVKWYGNNGAYQHLFSKRDSYGGDTMMFDLFIDPTTDEVQLDTNTNQKDFSFVLPKYKWVYLVWVHNVTDSLDQFYVNGERVANLAIATLGTGVGALNSIGAVEAGASEPFNGLIDEVVIGQSAPTWEDVVAMYAKYNYPSKWAYFKFDEGSGTTATDSSGNSNNGTIATATYITNKVMTTRSAITNRFLIQNISKSLNSIATSFSEYATVPFTLDPNGFNFSFWIKDLGAANNSRILSWWNGSNSGYELTKNADAFSSNMYNGGSNLINIGSIALTKYNVGKYYFVTVTFKPDEYKLFINAVQKGSTDVSCQMGTTVNSLTLFSRSDTLTSGFKGVMSHFTFQNTTTPWTQQQIDDLYWRNKIPSGALQWGMNDVATDQNGENALTLTGTSYSTDVPLYMKPRTAV